MDRMIGRTCPVGPGGRDCVCCGNPPGKRRAPKRHAKRSERQKWQRDARREVANRGQE